MASLLSLPGTARAEATLADGFVYVPGESGEAGCLPQGGDGPLLDVVENALREVELDPDFAVVLTARVLTCSSIFYTAISNDVTGIGYQRSDPEELFDRNPDTALEGVVFLNDLPYWFQYPDEFRSAFLHEIGHRFLARVHATAADEDIDLTGRQGGHWSYFLDTGGSPLEGNVFSDDDVPVASAPQFPTRYSPLDLYLMGAYGPDEVPPFRLLTPDEPLGRDCNGVTLARTSPPQACEPLAVPGSWTSLELDDVISAEGPRSPSHDDARSTFSIAFLLLDPGGVGFDRYDCSGLSLAAADVIETFAEATDQRLTLVNAAAGASCDELALMPAPTEGCQLGPSGTASRDGRGGLVTYLSLALLWRVAAAARTRRDRRLHPG